MSPPETCLSVAIVTFDSRKTIRNTLDSILGQWPEDLSPQIIVVDNCSTDGTAEIVADYETRHPFIRLMRNSSNVGYGRAHNQALARVDSRYHVICNPDIIATDGAFDRLLSFMEEHADIGIVCPRFHYPDGTLQPLNRRHPNICDLFLRRFLPTGLRPLFQRRLAAYEMIDIGYDRTCAVQFMTGAFMFCRTSVLKTVGGFDERFFLYFEDADLSRKVQNHGERTVFYPRATVIHNWERMAHKSWKMAGVFSVSAFTYFQKWGWRIW